jgi:DNA-binding transcriptional ArsR family regulator
VLTNAGRTDEESGWSATLHDLFARRWRAKLRRLPVREGALATLGGRILAAAGELSAADLAAALRLRRREATATLDALTASGLAEPRDENGVTLWRAR